MKLNNKLPYPFFSNKKYKDVSHKAENRMAPILGKGEPLLLKIWQEKHPWVLLQPV